jgi:hypothetical protein
VAQPAPAVTTSQSVTASTGSLTNLTTTVSRSTSASKTESSGSGDEVPISTQALFTGRGGRILPNRVSVPPFIAVTVVLHGADRGRYSLTLGDKRLQVGEARDQASLKLHGLKPGGRYVLTTGGGQPPSVTIVANAEPGP